MCINTSTDNSRITVCDDKMYRHPIQTAPFYSEVVEIPLSFPSFDDLLFAKNLECTNTTSTGLVTAYCREIHALPMSFSLHDSLDYRRNSYIRTHSAFTRACDRHNGCIKYRRHHTTPHMDTNSSIVIDGFADIASLIWRIETSSSISGQLS